MNGCATIYTAKCVPDSTMIWKPTDKWSAATRKCVPVYSDRAEWFDQLAGFPEVVVWSEREKLPAILGLKESLEKKL